MAVVQGQFGVVVFVVGDPGHSVGKGHGFVEVGEHEAFLQSTVDQAPADGGVAVELGELRDHGGGGQSLGADLN